MDFTEGDFDKFLFWLDPDRERAARKYEEVRRRLIKIFTCRGCPEADDLADETINRVIRKAQKLTESYVGDPARYFHGVARKVHLEYVRKPTPVLHVPPPDPPQEKEREYDCLDACLGQLPDETRRLILEYYQDKKRAKIDHRKEMADRLGIAPNTLRIRMHRTRARLQGCVESCLKHATPE